ncbi:MAG: hypothetical protein KHZ93_05120 [Clostridiales bacterium]|nr:hypothetical protein [Clostridiales bacterium]
MSTPFFAAFQPADTPLSGKQFSFTGKKGGKRRQIHAQTGVFSGTGANRNGMAFSMKKPFRRQKKHLCGFAFDPFVV